MTDFPTYPAPDSEPGKDGTAGLFRHAVRMAAIVQNLLRGRLNVVGEVTLEAEMTTTTLVHPNLTAFSALSLDPLSAEAAAALPGIFTPAESRQNGQWVLHHPSASSPRTFRFTVIG